MTQNNGEIISSRTFLAPIETVYKAWTDPKHLQVWWGPNGFSNTFEVYDLKPGGKWRFIMHGPDKVDYLNECEFLSIMPPTYISWNHISNPAFKVITTFEALSALETNLIFRMIFKDAKQGENMRAFILEKNEENFDRLTDELMRMISNK